MKINIHGSKVAITDSIKEKIEDKLGKLDKYFETPDSITANVVVRVQGVNQVVEVTIPAKRMILRAEVASKDLYNSIDLVQEKLERQIRKNKARMNKKANRDSVADFVLDFEVEEVEEEDQSLIVKRKEIDMKPMSEEEAILQMNMLGHEFFIFRDSETNDIALIYRRKDGNYGLIETK